MARLINCNSFEELYQLFVALCISCSARKIFPELINAICYEEYNLDVDMDYLPELDEGLPNELGDSITYVNINLDMEYISEINLRTVRYLSKILKIYM